MGEARVKVGEDCEIKSVWCHNPVNSRVPKSLRQAACLEVEFEGEESEGWDSLNILYLYTIAPQLGSDVILQLKWMPCWQVTKCRKDNFQNPGFSCPEWYFFVYHWSKTRMHYISGTHLQWIVCVWQAWNLSNKKASRQSFPRKEKPMGGGSICYCSKRKETWNLKPDQRTHQGDAKLRWYMDIWPDVGIAYFC